jgi:hypothetical protein
VRDEAGVDASPVALHKMGLGINLGGTIFGLVALNPSVARIGDRSERGRVLNEAWMRFQAIGTLAMGVTVATWRLGSLKEAESDIDATLAGIKNVLLGGALLTTLASVIAGRRIARQAPEGATPVESGAEPAPETPEEAARSQRLLGRRHGRAGGRRAWALLGARGPRRGKAGKESGLPVSALWLKPGTETQ